MKNMKDEANIFKVLRAADSSVIGGTRPIEVSKAVPLPVHFSNAKGGLRVATIPEIRACAAASAIRTRTRLESV
jgi:hypothetical protein